MRVYAGSNPVAPTNFIYLSNYKVRTIPTLNPVGRVMKPRPSSFALLSQLVEETALEAVQSRFESEGGYQLIPCIAQW